MRAFPLIAFCSLAASRMARGNNKGTENEAVLLPEKSTKEVKGA